MKRKGNNELVKGLENDKLIYEKLDKIESFVGLIPTIEDDLLIKLIQRLYIYSSDIMYNINDNYI